MRRFVTHVPVGPNHPPDGHDGSGVLPDRTPLQSYLDVVPRSPSRVHTPGRSTHPGPRRRDRETSRPSPPSTLLSLSSTTNSGSVPRNRHDRVSWGSYWTNPTRPPWGKMSTLSTPESPRVWYLDPVGGRSPDTRTRPDTGSPPMRDKVKRDETEVGFSGLEKGRYL